ncbi:hypothetical protein HK099_006576 [Clydaea vesicula]|uniref:CID domain-containing protein n=1 Tax=Clydaea vesicula TaxID=447962 RepID=A0AAD5U299_9FUNG|nr:hypothetical protein HK099_006576 [Clydaea vesicula]
MYLIDSILKNVGEPYLKNFQLFIQDMFKLSFDAVHYDDKIKLIKLLNTWRPTFERKAGLFSKEILFNLDNFINSKGNNDFNILIQQNQNIHFNPNFKPQIHNYNTHLNTNSNSVTNTNNNNNIANPSTSLLTSSSNTNYDNNDDQVPRTLLKKKRAENNPKKKNQDHITVLSQLLHLVNAQTISSQQALEINQTLIKISSSTGTPPPQQKIPPATKKLRGGQSAGEPRQTQSHNNHPYQHGASKRAKGSNNVAYRGGSNQKQRVSQRGGIHHEKYYNQNQLGGDFSHERNQEDSNVFSPLLNQISQTQQPLMQHLSSSQQQAVTPIYSQQQPFHPTSFSQLSQMIPTTLYQQPQSGQQFSSLYTSTSQQPYNYQAAPNNAYFPNAVNASLPGTPPGGINLGVLNLLGVVGLGGVVGNDNNFSQTILQPGADIQKPVLDVLNLFNN